MVKEILIHVIFIWKKNVCPKILIVKSSLYLIPKVAMQVWKGNIDQNCEKHKWIPSLPKIEKTIDA